MEKRKMRILVFKKENEEDAKREGNDINRCLYFLAAVFLAGAAAALGDFAALAALAAVAFGAGFLGETGAAAAAAGFLAGEDGAAAAVFLPFGAAAAFLPLGADFLVGEGEDLGEAIFGDLAGEEAAEVSGEEGASALAGAFFGFAGAFLAGAAVAGALVAFFTGETAMTTFFLMGEVGAAAAALALAFLIGEAAVAFLAATTFTAGFFLATGEESGETSAATGAAAFLTGAFLSALGNLNEPETPLPPYKMKINNTLKLESNKLNHNLIILNK